MAFTEAQREWLLARAGGECEFGSIDSEGGIERCGSSDRITVCHILPPLWCQRLYPDWDFDCPDNGIVLCRFHLEERFPDIKEARATYAPGNKAFRRMASLRAIKTGRYDPYWNIEWDVLLTQIADMRTKEYLRRHPSRPFPLPRRKRSVVA